jgi:uncharacterized protein YukE
MSRDAQSSMWTGTSVSVYQSQYTLRHSP